MTDLQREIGSLIIPGFSGASLPDDIKTCLMEPGLAGVILFRRNYKDLEQIKQLTASIRNAATDALIAVDQEGGRVVRFVHDFPCFPAASYYGERNDPEGLVQATDVTSSWLRSAGVNLNLVPLCDLRPSDDQHVIYARAYSADPQETLEVVTQQIAAIRARGLLSCAKHFPGLQSGEGDPHHVHTVSNRTLAEFRNCDYLPFAAAITAGVDMVMVTHLTAAAVDETNPATFSSKFIKEELRNHLGFEGLIVSDDLNMTAAAEQSSPAERAAQTIIAGCDLLIFGELPSNPGRLIGEISNLAEKDTDLAVRIGESAGRVRSFKVRNANRI